MAWLSIKEMCNSSVCCLRNLQIQTKENSKYNILCIVGIIVHPRQQNCSGPFMAQTLFLVLAIILPGMQGQNRPKQFCQKHARKLPEKCQCLTRREPEDPKLAHIHAIISPLKSQMSPEHRPQLCQITLNQLIWPIFNICAQQQPCNSKRNQTRKP